MNTLFKPIDVERVPRVKLYNGIEIPAIGLGTFGSDNYSPAQVAEAVKRAVLLGYRHIDCASIYGNEKEIGAVLKELQQAGVVQREELWITSKVWNNRHDDVVGSCKQSLLDLELDYLDLFLVHWPFPNHHASGVSVDSRDPHAVPYIHENYMKTWEAMESLLDAGLVRCIGTSNMTIPKMELLLRDCRVKPVVNEMELHPHFQQREFFDYLNGNGIKAIGFCPIGSPGRPDRDKTSEDSVPMEDPVIVEIAKRHGVHPAIVCVKWAIQNGQIPIPFSVKPEKYYANLRSATEAPLSTDEMEQIRRIDKNCRLSKDMFFLWPEAEDWRDLLG